MYSDGPGNRTPSLSGHHQQSLRFPFVLCRTVPDSFFSSDLSLPNQFMQNHIHELAKSLPVPPPAPRKQNTACDACRSVDRLMFCPFFYFLFMLSDPGKSGVIGFLVKTRYSIPLPPSSCNRRLTVSGRRTVSGWSLPACHH